MKQQCKIKLCGIRRLEDVAYMNEFMPDYVGFVFAPSRRQVSLPPLWHWDRNCIRISNV
ncbi:MAG: hypothetical protein V8Q17_08180 [Acutalibacteraceae bacterium]